MNLLAQIFAIAAIIACTSAALSPELASHFIPSFATGHIIKGENAIPYSAPYIVSLSASVNRSHSCGGTIIAKDWVLTAAHCISKPVGMKVIAGLYKRNELTNFTQTRFVDFGRVHELYKSGVGPYDIALLHLSEPFEYTRYVQAAALPALGEIPHGNATLFGWGQDNAIIPTLPKPLQTVEAHVMNWDECKEKLPENAPLATTNVCTDYYGKGISACNGDSGGPLVQEIEGAPAEIIGVVSWGYIPCGMANMPSVYTRVSAYINWIVKIMDAYYTLY